MTALRLAWRRFPVAAGVALAAAFTAWTALGGARLAGAVVHFAMSGTGAALLVIGLAAFVIWRRVRELESTEKKFQALLEAVPDAIVITRKDGRIVRVNAQAGKLFGYLPEELLDRPVEDLLRPRAKETGASQLLRDATTTSKGEIDPGPGYVGRRRDGTEVAVEVRFGPLKDNRELRLIHVIRDVTDQVQKERRRAVRHAVRRVLLETETFRAAAPALLQALCEGLGWDFGAFWLVEPSTPKLRLAASWHAPNVQANEFAALSRERAFAPGDDGPGRVWMNGDRPWVVDVDKSGSVRAPFASKAGLRQSLGVPIAWGKEVIGTIELFRRERRPSDEHLAETMNIIATQIGHFLKRERAEEVLRRTEEQFRHAQKLEAVGRLASGIAHDFNNLLTIIKGCGELLSRNIPADSPLRRHVEALAHASERAAGLTRQLLAFGRKQTLRPQLLNLNAIVSSTEQMLRRLLGPDVKLTTELTPDPHLIKADAGQVEQVIMNLAINARDAMPRGGSLTLTTANVEVNAIQGRPHPDLPPGPYLLLTVGDTGCGMDEATRARIFEPFFTTKEVGKGTGLGLATAYGIVKQSGGHIELETAPGQGTTFRIYLPPAQEASPAAHSVPKLTEPRPPALASR